MLMNVPGVRQRPSPSHGAFIPSRYSRCSGISVDATLIISRRCRHHQPETSLPTALVLRKPHPQPPQLLLRYLPPPNYASSYLTVTLSVLVYISLIVSFFWTQAPTMRGRFGTRASMRKIMWVLSTHTEICLRFSIFSIESLGFYALKQLFRDLQLNCSH